MPSIALSTGDLAIPPTTLVAQCGNVGAIASAAGLSDDVAVLRRVGVDRLAAASSLTDVAATPTTCEPRLEHGATEHPASDLKPESRRSAVPVPSIAGAGRLVRDCRLCRSDRAAMTRRVRPQIALLQERRQALITAAVTGQLDIPEAA